MSVNSASILLVEDNEADVELAREAFSQAGTKIEFDVCRDGADALERLEALAASGERLPDLVLLDLNLPRLSGRELLRLLRDRPKLQQLIVVVFSSSADESDIYGAYQDGCNAYVAKPLDFSGFVQVAGQLADHWFGLVQRPPQPL